MSTQTPEHELWYLVKDALRYRELRKHRNRGYPQPGIPFAMGWALDEDEKLTGGTHYIRERELDDALDEIIFADDKNVPHPIDAITESLLSALRRSESILPASK